MAECGARDGAATCNRPASNHPRHDGYDESLGACRTWDNVDYTPPKAKSAEKARAGLEAAASQVAPARRVGAHAPLHRVPDEQASILGAQDVSVRLGRQQSLLLDEYRQAWEEKGEGLANFEAGERAGLEESCYWKRCTDLRQLGLIKPTGELRNNPKSDSKQQVYRYAAD